MQKSRISGSDAGTLLGHKSSMATVHSLEEAVSDDAAVKRIADERMRIEGYHRTVSGAMFFNDREYHGDMEWLILAYVSDILSATGWPAPQFAKKLSPPDPDFQTFLSVCTPFRRVEVTEILRPGYRRGVYHRELATSDRLFHEAPEPHPRPWSSFGKVLGQKLAKSYSPGSWLVIYHDMGISEFKDFMPWHERILNELRTWTSDSSPCNITKSQYKSIFVIDCSGIGAVRLHPHWDVLREVPFPD
jgi:hypothetical protein